MQGTVNKTKELDLRDSRLLDTLGTGIVLSFRVNDITAVDSGSILKVVYCLLCHGEGKAGWFFVFVCFAAVSANKRTGRDRVRKPSLSNTIILK